MGEVVTFWAEREEVGRGPEVREGGAVPPVLSGGPGSPGGL